jgi:hypothetical protein
MDGRKVRKTKGDRKRSVVCVHIIVKGVELAVLTGNFVSFFLKILLVFAGPWTNNSRNLPGNKKFFSSNVDKIC